MLNMYLLTGAIIIGLIILALVIIPYLKCYMIYKKYSSSCQTHFVPLLGALLTQLQYQKKGKDPLLLYFQNRNHNRKFIVSNILNKPFILIEDETLTKDLLLNHQNFTKFSNFLFGQYYFTKNIISQNGQEWQRQKKIMSKAINFDFISKLVPQIQSVASAKIDQIQINKPLSFQKLIFQFNAETISLSFFSQNLSQIKIKDKNLVSQLTRVINYSIDRSSQLYTLVRLGLIPVSSINWGFFLTKQQKQVLNDFKLVKKIILDKVNERIKKIKEQGNVYQDFLSYYLELYTDQKNNSIQMEEILQQFDSLLVAGSDTGAVLGGMCIYCLAKYPEWYKLLQAKCNQLRQNLNIESLNDIEQLTYFIKQVSRFYPPAPFLFPRLNTKEVKLGQFTFPAGCYFTPNIKVIMNNQNVFENSSQFNPLRWKSLSSNIWSYLTFSAGPRSCLGQKLAMTSLKILLVQFIRKFKVKLNEKVELQMVIKTLYQPKQQNLVIPIPKQ